MAGLFQSAVLTDLGIALNAKAQAGKCTITLTKAVSGNGSYTTSEDIQSRTALKNQKQEFSLTTVTVKNQSNVWVKFTMSNNPSGGTPLTNGYYVTEVGLYAKDPDEGEILYAIAIGVENQWDYMPAYNDILPSTITIDFLTEVTNAETVAIEAPNQFYLYDEATGDKYVFGIQNGLMYYEEAD